MRFFAMLVFPDIKIYSHHVPAFRTEFQLVAGHRLLQVSHGVSKISRNGDSSVFQMPLEYGREIHGSYRNRQIYQYIF